MIKLVPGLRSGLIGLHVLICLMSLVSIKIPPTLAPLLLSSNLGLDEGSVPDRTCRRRALLCSLNLDSFDFMLK